MEASRDFKTEHRGEVPRALESLLVPSREGRGGSWLLSDLILTEIRHMFQGSHWAPPLLAFPESLICYKCVFHQHK